MADLSYAELKRVWLTAARGTRYDNNAWASLMAAIAEAESSGDPNATNPDDNGGRQTSWGLWQISNGTHSPVSSQWANPVVNAQLAIQKLESTGLGAWGTYDTGAYKAYLNDGTTPSSTIPGTGGSAGQAAAQLTAAETASSVSARTQCALGFDQHVGLFFGHGPTVQFCVLSKTQVRAFYGGLFILLGGLAGLGGLAVLLAATTGFEVTKLTSAVAKGVAGAKEIKNAPAQERAAAQQAADKAAIREAREAPAQGSHARRSQRRRPNAKTAGEARNAPASGKHSRPEES